ncbi:hypothetical protein PMAYCL1PPCAC_32817, partial [Pristionchus mayeri]
RKDTILRVPSSRPSSRPASFFHCGEIVNSSNSIGSIYDNGAPPDIPNEDNANKEEHAEEVEDEEEEEEKKSCIPSEVSKYAKILTPHIILICVLVGYLSVGAWILMALETNSELQARSRKLVKVTNLMRNYTAESWSIISDAQHGNNRVTKEEWEAIFRFACWPTSSPRRVSEKVTIIRIFREYILRISETVDDRRPIRKELATPDELENMHNKWTFPTSLLYVLTVLTTCGYGEVSVDTAYGKIFSVSFAFLGIPLMFITAADIGKFLSETLVHMVNQWNRLMRRFVNVFCYGISGRRLSIPSSTGNTDMLDLFGVTENEEKLWFPICEYSIS